jgi:PAS domain S-box-containing protein
MKKDDTELRHHQLMHELEVHQTELNIQNEELRTSRLETEAALERYTEIFDFAPVGYAVLAPDGIIRELNLCGAQLLGRVRVYLVGRRFDEFVIPEMRRSLRELLAEVVLDDSKCNRELELTTGRHVHCTATIMRRMQAMVLLAFTDVTEQRTRERKLASADLAVREAEHRKDEFLSALSHELRNPLGPIRNSLFIMSRAEPGSEQGKSALAVIDRQVAHLTRLVDDLLDVTRIARGKMQIHRAPLDLSVLVQRAVDDQRAGFDQSGITVEAAIEPSVRVSADGARITQVLSNLLNNAEKFSTSGGRVTVTLRRVDNVCRLSVRDTGVGIDPAQLPHLFEAFSQAPQTVDRSRGGLGLGLTTVKGLVELHGGSVAIESAGPQKGTEVVVTLPIEASAQWTAPVASLPRAVAHRILVIDDNVDGATSMQDALVLLGHDVRVAYTGTEGLAVAHDFHPEVVICDIGLPDLDGYGVASTMRKDAELNQCLLIALSGYAQPADVARARAAGFDQHLAKPASVKKIADAVAQVHLHA